MSDINSRFGGTEPEVNRPETQNSIYLYSAFSNYDELINCAISIASLIAGKFYKAPFFTRVARSEKILLFGYFIIYIFKLVKRFIKMEIESFA